MYALSLEVSIFLLILSLFHHLSASKRVKNKVILVDILYRFYVYWIYTWKKIAAIYLLNSYLYNKCNEKDIILQAL